MPIFEPIRMPKHGIDAFYEGMANSHKMYNEMTQAKLNNAKANLPFGGASVPGPAGQIVGLEMVKERYGENSPQYQNAKAAFDLTQTSATSRNDYQNALTKSMPIRYTTGHGKEMIERSNVNQGYSPAGTPVGEPVSPGQAPYYPKGEEPRQNANDQGENPDQMNNMQQGNNEAANQYDLLQTKQNIPASVMQKNLYATNIEKTLDSINLSDLTYYNGPIGQTKLAFELSKDFAGRPTSEAFKKYVDAEKKFGFLGGQVRQFYGDSIQPSAMEKLQEKLDPRSATKSAKTGIAGFDSTKDLLKKELETYRDAMKSSAVYKGGKTNAARTENPESAAETEGNVPPPDTSWWLRPDGKKVAVHFGHEAKAKELNYQKVE